MQPESQVSPTLTIVGSPPSNWNVNIETYLTDHGYTLHTVSTEDIEAYATGDPKADAILALEKVNLDVFRLIRNQSEDALRPLLVLITDDTSGTFPDDWADLILPPNPNYIDYQLKTVLRLRAENTQLKAKQSTLTTEIDKLTEAAAKQKRSLSEIEILKNAIVRNVSHELKTPLLQVKSAVSLLAEDAKDEELIEYAKNATARLETLVKNITLLGSSLDVNPGPVIVRDAIEYSRRHVGRIWEYRKEIGRIDLKIADGLPPVLVDKQGFNTVLQLLMDNALKFSQKPVVVSAERINDGKEDQVKIAIVDNGIGIAKDQLDAIFEIFYQVDRSSTRRYGGMGIGLAIVQLILERHNTTIQVDSTVGKGSTFYFYLPIVKL